LSHDMSSAPARRAHLWPPSSQLSISHGRGLLEVQSGSPTGVELGPRGGCASRGRAVSHRQAELHLISRRVLFAEHAQYPRASLSSVMLGVEAAERVSPQEAIARGPTSELARRMRDRHERARFEPRATARAAAKTQELFRWCAALFQETWAAPCRFRSERPHAGNAGVAGVIRRVSGRWRRGAGDAGASDADGYAVVGGGRLQSKVVASSGSSSYR
jgi:hypothetical protein